MDSNVARNLFARLIQNTEKPVSGPVSLSAEDATSLHKMVVVSMDARALWSSATVEGAEGVRHVFQFNPRSPHNRMVGKQSPCRWRGFFAVVFFDFRRQLGGFRAMPSAERLRADSAAEPSSPLHKLLFCVAPGFLPGRVAPNRFAEYIPLLQENRS